MTTVVEIAKKLNKDPAILLISWAVQRGAAVLPKSVTPSRIESNFQGKSKPLDPLNSALELTFSPQISLSLMRSSRPSTRWIATSGTTIPSAGVLMSLANWELLKLSDVLKSML